MSRATESVLRELAAGYTPWKLACRVASTTNQTLTGLPIIDGVQTVAGDRVLATGQTDATANGIYVAAARWTRAEDFSADLFLKYGTVVPIVEGTAHGLSLWMMSSPTGAAILGVDELAFSEVNNISGEPSGVLTFNGRSGAVVPLAADYDAHFLTPPTTIAFALPLTINGNHAMEITAGSGALNLVLNDTGHIAGSVLEIIVRASSGYTSVVPAPDLNAGAWEAFVAGGVFKATIYCHSDGNGGVTFESSGKNAGTRDTATPTISTAIISGNNPNALVVTFSDAMYVPDLTGLSLAFTSGTARTLTAVESGSGTAVVTYTLSGNCSDGDEADFVIASNRTLRKFNGPKLAAQSFEIQFQFAIDIPTIPGNTHWWDGRDVTVSGSNILTIVDQVGDDDMPVVATHATVGTLNGTPSISFGASIARYVATVSPAEVMTSGWMAIICDLPSMAGILKYMAVGSNNGTADDLRIHCEAASITGKRGAQSLETVNPPNDLVCFVFTWDGSGADWYWDGAIKGTNGTTSAPANITEWTLGASTVDDTWPMTDTNVGMFAVGTGRLDVGSVTLLENHMLATYPA